jgi:S-adenosylmethionine synthetase
LEQKVDQDKITKAVNDIFDMRPKAIVQRLDLLRPIYSETAAYGHFGRNSDNGGFTWENLTYLDELKARF